MCCCSIGKAWGTKEDACDTKSVCSSKGKGQRITHYTATVIRFGRIPRIFNFSISVNKLLMIIMEIINRANARNFLSDIEYPKIHPCYDFMNFAIVNF